MEKIQLKDEITAIIERNLDEKVEKEVVKIKSCEECRYHDDPWIWGRSLHCCSHDSDNVRTSRDEDELFKNCPINGQMEITKNYIKKYGIIHEKDAWYGNSYVAIVDFSSSHWESDGYNPDIRWDNVAVFYYENKEDEEKMMEMALDYYHRFDFDEQYTKKRCYG